MSIDARRTVLAAFLGFLAAAPAAAQTGAIVGNVTDANARTPVSNAEVHVRNADGNVLANGLTDEQGRYRLAAVPAGTYTLVVTLIGYDSRTIPGVQVTAGGTTTVHAALTAGLVSLEEIVVTASKKQEKALESPKHTAIVTTRQIEERPTVTPVDHVRAIPGIDVIQQGVQATNVVARGFNNIFSTTLHTLTDYRMASVPSLRVNLMHFVPSNNEDIERIEVVLGPGAALYGPNTSSGVLHMLTRSPLDHQGSVVSFGMGTREILQGSFRTAHLLGDDVGFKVSGQYLQGREWELAGDEQIAVDELIAGAIRDYDIQRYAGEARLDWRVTPLTTAVLSAGHTIAASGIELTGIGAGQTLDWKYSYVQARASRDRLFGQVYLNMSDAGDTFILSNGLPIVDDSKVLVAQLQHGLQIGERQNFTYGGDMIRTMPDTRGTIHGRNEDDDLLLELGAYLQSETELSSRFDLVLAGRVDHHSLLDDAAIFSPRAALVFKPGNSHAIRATFDQAFSTPVSFNLFLDLDAGPVPGAAGQVLGYRVRAMGTEPNGFRWQDGSGAFFGMRSPFAGLAGLSNDQPIPVETGTLWDLGVSALQHLGRIDAATADYLRSFDPTSAQLGTNVFQVSSGILSPAASTVVPDIGRVQENRNSTLELGYKGVLGSRVSVTASVWREERSSFTSPLTVFSPLLLLDSAGIFDVAYQAFLGAGQPDAVARAEADTMAEGLSGIPVAVATSPDATNEPSPYFIATYRNFGDVSLWGSDVSVTAQLTDDWSFTVGGSFVNKDHFYFEDEGYLVGLNAPRHKAMAAVNYRNVPLGLNGELRARYSGEFPVSSAPYSATGCIARADVDLPGFNQPCISAYTLLDLNLGYRLPFVRGASAQITVTNLLDDDYRSFVAVPAIGRMAILRLRYEF